MTWAEINRTPSDRLLRQFAALCVLLALAVAARRWTQGEATTAAVWAVVGLAAALAGVLRPQSLKGLFVGLSMLTFPIGWVVTQAMLLVLFGVVITPLALVFRLMGRDRLRLRADPGRTTLWTPHRDTPDAERYLRQY